jgi:hypothetical protein
MTIPETWHAPLEVALAILALLAGYMLLQEHDARLRADAASAVQERAIDQAEKDAQGAQANLVAQLKALEIEKAAPATPQQIIVDGSKLMPALPQPITIQTAPSQPVSGPASRQAGAPDAPDAPPQQIVIPAADFKAIQAAEIGCQETGAKLTACTQTAADTAVELKATAAQRDEWKSAAKGGTWLHRTVTAAKWIGIGAAVGYGMGHKW